MTNSVTKGNQQEEKLTPSERESFIQEDNNQKGNLNKHQRFKKIKAGKQKSSNEFVT